MFAIGSMTQATILIVVTVFFLLLFALRENPFRAAGAFVQDLFTVPKFLLHFLAMLAILFFNKMELWLESQMVKKTDFTSMIYGLEGNFAALLQRMFENSVLTQISVFFYVVVFPCLMVVSIAIYTYRKQYKLFYAVCYALMFNYMIAIPFFLFFPVQEVWHFHPGVRFLMLDVFPSFESEYRPMSGLDNCLPSLHTSISVSMAIIAARSGNLFWKWFTRLTAGFIIFTIFYLGVHWISDMAGGILLALLASHLALRISEGRSFLGSWADSRLKSRLLGK